MKGALSRLLARNERARRRRDATDYLQYDGPERRAARRGRAAHVVGLLRRHRRSR